MKIFPKPSKRQAPQHCSKLLLLVMLYCSSSVMAQVASEPVTVDPEPLIQVSDEMPLDSRIEDRMQNIFSKINGLEQVAVTVDAGVVMLSGDVVNEGLARDAMDIAIRTAGVVTVSDEINRTLDVGGNVRPLLEGFAKSFNAFYRALPLIVLAMVILIVFIVVSGWVARWSSLWRRIAPNPFLSELLSQAVRIVIIITGVILALNLLGASRFVTTLLGGAGVLGIAIGFAVRDSLENYISSIMLSLRQPFRAQDHVVINQHEGIVVRLTSRATILMTLDGNHLRIPNSIVFKGIILNYSTNPERRFDFTLGIDAADDPLAAMQVGLDAIDQHESVLQTPGSSALIDSVGDSNIIIMFTGWVNQAETDFSKARSVAIKAAKVALEENGFTLPEPIYRLRFDQQPFELRATESTLKPAETEAASQASNASANKTAREEKPDAELDVSVDQQLLDKVSQERAKSPDTDLLDHSQPAE